MLGRFGMTLVLWVCLLAGCGGSAAPTFSLVGHWKCTTPNVDTPDSAEVKADGTITITSGTTGQTFSGTWTMSGTTITLHGLGPGGTETWTVNGERVSNAIGQACTRA
jgi:hypothetical protein